MNAVMPHPVPFHADIETLPLVFEVLRHALPLQRIVHVGAGLGTGPVHAWRSWNLAGAILIDAQEDRVAKLQAQFRDREGWAFVAAAVGKAGEQLFYHVSNPDESGLVAPQDLQRLWPNLKHTEQTLRSVQSLDDLVAGVWSQEAQNKDAWLIIDTLPAAAILKDAANVLARCSVVVARLIVGETAIEDARFDDVDQVLNAYGLRHSLLIATHHPAIGYGLWLRDGQQEHLETLARERAALEEAHRKALAQERAAMQQAQDEALVKLRQELDRKEAQIAALQQVQEETLAKIRQDLKQKEEQLAALQQQLAERDARLALMEQEIIRAEAQIDLIKDLVLRDGQTL